MLAMAAVAMLAIEDEEDGWEVDDEGDVLLRKIEGIFLKAVAISYFPPFLLFFSIFSFILVFSFVFFSNYKIKNKTRTRRWKNIERFRISLHDI